MDEIFLHPVFLSLEDDTGNYHYYYQKKPALLAGSDVIAVQYGLLPAVGG